ncbi:MAG: MAPEG family protein [Gammaproteobacteria bacterium]
MDNVSILAPAAVLVLWSLVMLAVLTVTRFAAFGAAGVSLGSTPAGARYADVEADMPARTNWISHNYTHLMEQPTIFYAIVIVLAVAGAGTGINLTAAWAYAGIRIVHSLWQSTVNTIPVRVTLFALSTLCLWVLAVNAIRVTLLT